VLLQPPLYFLMLLQLKLLICNLLLQAIATTLS
jgi:hypothetical protein